MSKELKNGADFAKLAKENSKDPGTAQTGGSLGEFQSIQMVKEFTDALKTMKKDQISDPVKSNYGYHIIKLDSDRKPLKFEDVKTILEKTLQQEKFEKFIKKLQEQAKVKKYIDPKDKIEIPEKYQPKSQTPAEDKAKTQENAKEQKSEK